MIKFPIAALTEDAIGSHQGFVFVEIFVHFQKELWVLFLKTTHRQVKQIARKSNILLVTSNFEVACKAFNGSHT